MGESVGEPVGEPVDIAILNRPLAPNTGGTRIKAHSIRGLGACSIAHIRSHCYKSVDKSLPLNPSIGLTHRGMVELIQFCLNPLL
jgi:hypothetical protein